MVGVAIGWIAYVFSGLLSSPSDSQTIWQPSAAEALALPAEAAPTPTWGPGDTAANGSHRSQGRAAASNSDASPLTASAPPPDPTPDWGGVPPGARIPPITPVHPLLGPDF